MKDNRIKKFTQLSQYLDAIPCAINKAESVNITDYRSDNKPISSVVFHNETVVKTILRYDNPLTLVFGSAKNPGGGVLRGSTAQEEDISLSSTWYFNVKDNTEFYGMIHPDLTYSDKMLYVPEAYMLNNELGHSIKPKKISFIGGAAPNINGMKSSGQTINEKVVYEILRNRIFGLLSFAEVHNHKILILGAWGCGVFGLSPEKVANIFKECIESKLYTGMIVFSILDINQHCLFKKIIM